MGYKEETYVFFLALSLNVILVSVFIVIAGSDSTLLYVLCVFSVAGHNYIY